MAAARSKRTPKPRALAEAKAPPPIVQDPSAVYVRLPAEVHAMVTQGQALLDAARAAVDSARTAESALRALVDAVSALEKRRRHR